MAYTPLKLDGIEIINIFNKDGEQTIATTGDQGIVVSGKIQGTELEGTSLDINGSADISGSLTGLNGSLTTTANYFQLNTPSGYIQIGAMNTSHAHIYTDRASFYTNKPILVSGDTVLTSASGVMLSGNQTIAGNKTFSGNVTLESASPVLKIDATGTGNPEILFTRITGDDQNAKIRLLGNQLAFENEGDPDSTFLFQGRAAGAGSLSDFLKIEDTGITAPGATFTGDVFSNSNFSKFFFQSLLLTLFVNGPLHPFLLS